MAEEKARKRKSPRSDTLNSASNVRPAIPRQLERDVLVEAGHRCAIPTCKQTPVQIAHIVPWETVREHTFDNLIALCPNCHDRYDNKGEIDRKAMLQYKANLSAKSRVAHDEQIEQKVVGIVDFRDAINAHDWEQAEKVLQKHPNLPGARSDLGLRMSNEVQEYFSSLLYRQGHPHWPGRRLTESWSFPQFMVDIQKAFQWLEEALKHQDDPEGQVSAALALMYGFNERYAKMMNAVGEARTNHPALLSYLQTPDHLMMLIYACNKDRSRIQELMGVLDLPLPSEEEVRIAIQEPSASIQDQVVDWYAVELYVGADTSKMPVKVRIFCPHTQETVQVTKALIFGQGQQAIPRSDYSKEPDPTHPSERAFDLPVDELLKQLFDEFLFLCPTHS